MTRGRAASERGSRVLLLLDHAENRRLLAEWLTEHSTHVPVVPEDAPPESGGDLCVVDSRSLVRHREWLERWKDRERPTFAPVLCVRSSTDAVQSSSLWDLIDEAITTPLQPNVFERRLNNLLERRGLSVELTSELERTENRYRAVFEATNDALFVVDPTTNDVEECNPRACALLGYTRAELRSLSFAEDVHAGPRAAYDEFVDAVVSREERATEELTCLRADGTELLAEASASVLDEWDGVRLVYSVRDITERREKQRRLERQRDELDDLNRINETVRETTQAVARATSRGELEREVCARLVSAEPHVLAWIGVEEDGELVARTAVGTGTEYVDEATITTDETPTGMGPSGVAYRERRVSVVQDIQRDPAAEPWRRAARQYGFRSSVSVPIQHDDECYGVLNIYADRPDAFDATERAVLGELGESIGHAVDALRAHERAKLFEQAVEYAGNAIYITDGEGTIEHVNAAFEAQTGYDRADAVGSDLTFVEADATSGGDRSPWETVRAGEVWQDQLVSQRKDGRLRYLDRTIAPITEAPEGGDGVTHFVAVTADITTQRRRRQQLQALYRVLRHNLRNELNVIDGYADLIEGECEVESVRSATAKIRDAADQLLTMSEQANRIEETFSDAGSTSMRDARQTYTLPTILRQEVTALREAHPDARVAATIPETDRTVDAEFATALEELLTNAVKHNDAPTPRVALDASVRTDEEGVAWADVAVRDDGPGIPENERRVLRAGEETPLVHGNGLGLWLVNWVVNELGGEIDIHDDDPEGSVVTVRLPLG